MAVAAQPQPVANTLLMWASASEHLFLVKNIHMNLMEAKVDMYNLLLPLCWTEDMALFLVLQCFHRI